MTPAEIAATYRRAVEIIDDRGWGQGIGRGPRVCAMEAVAIAARLPRSTDDYTDADVSREYALLHPLERRVGTLTTVWNDATGRDVTEVRDTLLALADEHESGA